MSESDWKKDKLIRLRDAAERLIKKIDAANIEEELSKYSSKKFASVKRASLDLNEEGIRLRKGYYNDR